MTRLVKHLLKIINKKPKLSLATPNIIDTMSRKNPELSISPACLTSFPEPCQVCQEYHCSYNFKHGLVFSFNEYLDNSMQPSSTSLGDALEESLMKMWNGDREPPDDAGGWKVATIK